MTIDLEERLRDLVDEQSFKLEALVDAAATLTAYLCERVGGPNQAERGLRMVVEEIEGAVARLRDGLEEALHSLTIPSEAGPAGDRPGGEKLH